MKILPTKALVKNSLKVKHSTFVFTGHPLYGSFVVIMLTNRKCEHTYLCKLKNNACNCMLLISCDSQVNDTWIFHTFEQKKKTVNFSFFITVIDILLLWYFMYSYYLFHEVELRKNVLPYIFHTLKHLHLLPSINRLIFFFLGW